MYSWEKHEPPYPLAMSQIVSQLFFYKDGFGIKYPTNVDISLNKETKPNQQKCMCSTNINQSAYLHSTGVKLYN